MALPTVIQRLFSFTGFQQGQGDNAFPGTNIDADLDQTNGAVNALRAGLATLLRADGKLANGIVGRGSLAADVLLGVGPSKPWSASVAYLGNVDTVTRANKVYLAVRASTGVDPLLDVTSAYWLQTADLSQAVVVADGSIGANAFADKSLTEPKLADGAVSNRALGAGVVRRANAALNLGVLPVGATIDFDGPVLPAGWLWSAGQAISRTAYPDLFAALTVVFTATTTVGSPTLTAVSRSLVSLGLRGAAVEGPGIPNGTILLADGSSGAVTLSNTATAAGTVTLRLFPYGRGDGSSTFTLPDRRGRVSVGRDDMNGGAAGRITAEFDCSNLTSTGGGATFVLVNQNLPSALPGGAVTVSYPAHQYIKYGDLTTVSAGAGGTPVGNIWHNVAGENTQPPGNQSFGVTLSNSGGDQPISRVQPSGVTNKIIFAGV